MIFVYFVFHRIALGPKIAQYLGAIVPPVLACFNDPDSKVRYFACESMYNVVSNFVSNSENEL